MLLAVASSVVYILRFLLAKQQSRETHCQQEATSLYSVRAMRPNNRFVWYRREKEPIEKVPHIVDTVKLAVGAYYRLHCALKVVYLRNCCFLWSEKFVWYTSCRKFDNRKPTIISILPRKIMLFNFSLCYSSLKLVPLFLIFMIRPYLILLLSNVSHTG